MRVKTCHEICLSPKQFETIGFHHTGDYLIKIQVRRESQSETTILRPRLFGAGRDEGGRIMGDHYCSQKMQVAYNSQKFDMGPGFKCSWAEEQSAEVFLQGRARQAGAFAIEMWLMKRKTPPTQTQPRESAAEKNQSSRMYSTETMKKYLHDEREVANDLQASAQQREEGSCEEGHWEVDEAECRQYAPVGWLQVKINPNIESTHNNNAAFHMEALPQQQYFSKLYFTAVYASFSYLNNPTCLCLSPEDKLGGQRLPLQNPKAATQQQAKGPVAQLPTRAQQLYRHTVLQQALQYRALHSIVSQLKGTDSSPYVISIMDPAEIQTTDALMLYYEATTEADLLMVIYEESLAILHLTRSLWIELISRLEYCKWDAYCQSKAVSTLCHALEYLKEQRLRSFSNQSLLCYQQLTPLLRFSSNLHQKIPVFYVKRTENNQKRPKTTEQVSFHETLFILIHGLKGNESDMGRIKAFLSYLCPAQFLVLKELSAKADLSIAEIGKAAAQEISSYVSKRPFIRKINFVGFSLGGVVIRACLPHLSEYHGRFNIFITLAAPHLGIQYLNNCIVRTGIHFLHKVQGVENVAELLLKQDIKHHPVEAMQTHSEHQKQQITDYSTYLQRLSSCKCLGLFNLVVVCGSEDDGYVPGYSACLEYSGQSEVLARMCANLKSTARNLHQVWVKFDPSRKGTAWDRILNRRVHINFLDDDAFLHFLFGQYFLHF